MDHWFDGLARSVADKTSRRTFLLGGSSALAGVLLPYLLPRQALAKGPCPGGTEHCVDHLCCGAGATCVGHPHKHCICLSNGQPPCGGNGGFCCPSGSSCCGPSCCTITETCIFPGGVGFCCPTAKLCGTGCGCGSTLTCVNGKCCAPANQTCNSVSPCCPGLSCVSGICL